jgi:FkbM family methyltransferase
MGADPMILVAGVFRGPLQREGAGDGGLGEKYFLMLRIFRRLGGAVAPEWFKARLRPSLFGYRSSAVCLPVRFSHDCRSPFIEVGTLQYRFEEPDRPSIEYQFVDNGSAVEETSMFLELARDAGTFFDVGAAAGIFSGLFCLLNPRGRAIAFEPAPGAMRRLRALAVLNGCDARIVSLQVAVGAVSAHVPAVLLPGGFVALDSSEGAGESMGEIPQISLDNEVAESGVVPDILKVDVEGYELEVLTGAERLLATRRPIICLELHLDALARRHVAASRVLGTLRSHGYRLYNCLGQRVSATRVVNSAAAITRIVAR